MSIENCLYDKNLYFYQKYSISGSIHVLEKSNYLSFYLSIQTLFKQNSY